MKTLTLFQRISANWTTAEDYEYVVERVTDSIKPAVRTVLSQQQVVAYCDDDDWKVTIR